MVSFEVSNKCNYACWYCPPDLHAGTNDWLDLDASLRFFRELASTHDRVYVDLIGGEPTLWPRLFDFLAQLPDNVDVEITTNGSRSIRWWTDAKPHLQKVAISVHAALCDIDHLIAVVDLLRDTVTLHNNVLYDPKHRADVERYAQAMRERGIAAEVKPIIPSWETMLPYTNDEMTWMEQISSWPNQNLPPIRKPNKISVNGGKFTDMNLAVLAPQKNNFFGWSCWAGRNRFHVHHSGNILAASCGIASIGNITTGWEIRTAPITCNKPACWCIDDIAIEKFLA